MNIKFTPRLQLAINFAAESHRDQNRKNENKTPYISHPYSVMLLASEYTENEDIFISCLLHDVVEDCGVGLEEIEELFGGKVRDNLPCDWAKVFWIYRKHINLEREERTYLALLESGPREALMVAICDKIHNMSTMSEPLVHKGTFWFLDLVQEILNGRQQEIPESLYNKFVARLDASKQIFTNIDR